MSKLVIKSNYHWREQLQWWDLTDAEREWHDWADESTQFTRYKGECIPLCEYMHWDNPASITRQTTWQGVRSDSYFSGTVIRWSDDCETFQIGTYYVEG